MLPIDPATGRLHFDDPLVEIVGRMTEADARANPAFVFGAPYGTRSPEYCQARFSSSTTDGDSFSGIVTFFAASVLLDCSFAMVLPGDEHGWQSWSRQRENERKLRHDSLLTAAFRGLISHTAYNSTSYQLPWGQVSSLFDPKSGCSSIVVRWHRRSPGNLEATKTT